MKLIDFVLIAVIALAIILAVRHLIRFGKNGCSGCCGGCSHQCGERTE